MKLGTVVAILRHNTELAGDIRLACREFDSLVGAEGLAVRCRRDLEAILGNWGIATIIETSKKAEVIAVAWHNVEMDGVDRLLKNSAFAQEVFVLHTSASDQALFEAKCSSPHCTANDLSSSITTVALTWNYIIESEGVLDNQTKECRIQTTIDLLLEPYLRSRASSGSLRLRRAKKTTLSLTHDLHIYKAKFFPRLVRALLNIFADDTAAIVDPFCGSGTALLEAALIGLDSRGVDIDPICQLISRAKVAPFLQTKQTLAALDAFELALDRPSEPPETYLFPPALSKMLGRRDRIDGTSYQAEIERDAAIVASAIHSTTAKGPARDLIQVLASDAVTKKIRYRFIGVGNGRYTIEIVKKPILDRLTEKLQRCRELCSVFDELQSSFGFQLGTVSVSDGDARLAESWMLDHSADVIVTSPPYLPASSGREHYAASRALSFAVLGFEAAASGYYNAQHDGVHSSFDVSQYPEAKRLMDYLSSDASDTADPQRDAMRFERKAMPTRQYLADMRQFFEQTDKALSSDGRLLLVVANQHTFYSHRRKELEHVAHCAHLYTEIAADAGLRLEEEIKMELLKSAVSKARPRASEDYFETVLISQRSSRQGHIASSSTSTHKLVQEIAINS